MQFTTTVNDSKANLKLKDIAVAVPKTMYSTNVFGKDTDFDKYFVNDCENFELTNILTKQNPLISAWLVFSLVSICFLSPLLFIIH